MVVGPCLTGLAIRTAFKLWLTVRLLLAELPLVAEQATSRAEAPPRAATQAMVSRDSIKIRLMVKTTAKVVVRRSISNQGGEVAIKAVLAEISRTGTVLVAQ